MKTKNNQRLYCKNRLLDINNSSKTKWDIIILKKIIKYIIKNKVKLIGIYWSMDNEVDTRKIIDFCINNDISVYLPKTIEKQIVFYKYIRNKKLKYNKNYNIYEPFGLNNIDNYKIKTMIIPMIGYDENFNRIGHGMGFYDSFLLKNKSFKIGLAYKIQELDKILSNDLDVKMDLIITN